MFVQYTALVYIQFHTVFVMYFMLYFHLIGLGGEEVGFASANGCDPLYGGRRRSHTAVDWVILCNAMGTPLLCNE